MQGNRDQMINDFIAYWAAARILLTNGNAFLPAEQLEMQRSAGWTGSSALLMYYPPWTLSLFLPFGYFDYDTAQILWFLQNGVFIFLEALLLWRLYSNSPTPSRVGWVALLTFAPIFFFVHGSSWAASSRGPRWISFDGAQSGVVLGGCLVSPRVN